jgi:hypothetical protein
MRRKRDIALNWYPQLRRFAEIYSSQTLGTLLLHCIQAFLVFELRQKQFSNPVAVACAEDEDNITRANTLGKIFRALHQPPDMAYRRVRAGFY